MPFELGAMEGVRSNLLNKTAQRYNNSSMAGSYDNTITSVIDKINRGEDMSASSGADILRKIGKKEENDQNKAAGILSGTSSFTEGAALNSKMDDFAEALNVLLAKGKDSIFLKSAATTEEAREAFDLSCTADGNSFTMDVKRLAESQQNEGNDKELSKEAELSTGRKYFDLTIDGKTYSMVVKIEKEDTNESVMNKVVGAINRSNSGVTAELISDEDGKNGHITITSNGTGAPMEGQDRVFYFTNHSEDDIVSILGLDQMTREGVDAIFNFNGSEEDSTYMYNSALIDSTVSVEFKKVTDGPVLVEFDYDYDKLVESVQNYVDKYNALNRAVQHSTYKTVENYLKQIHDVFSDYTDELANIGLKIDVDGTMHFNSGFMYQTDIKELRDVLNRASDGYTSDVRRIADGMEGYLDRLSGKTKKYYGLKAKKSNAKLRELMNS